MPARARASIGAVLLWIAGSIGTPESAAARAVTADPAADPGGARHTKTLIAKLAPGDTLFLPPGIYPDRLNLSNVRGKPEAWITILGPSSGPPAVITTRSDCCNTVQLGGTGYVAIKNLRIDSAGLEGVDGIHAGNAPTHDILIENCELVGQGSDQSTVGISTKSPAWNWTLRGNTITEAGTGIYLGNSDGTQPFLNGVIEGNLVQNTIGYNLEVKFQVPYDGEPWVSELPSEPRRTLIRHNVFIKAKGGWPEEKTSGARPNVLVDPFPPAGAGSGDLYEIYGNLFYVNPDEALLQAAGRVSVHDNIFVGASSGNYSIYFNDHNGPIRLAHVYNNTIYTASGRGIGFGTRARQEDAVVGNLIFADDRPLHGPIAHRRDNEIASRAAAPLHVHRPSQMLHHMDFYPRSPCGACEGRPLDLSRFAGQTDYDRDFNAAPKGARVYRGAYAGKGTNPGWTLSATRKGAATVRPPGASAGSAPSRTIRDPQPE